MLTQPIKLPGWAAIALFIYTAIPDNISRVGFWIDVTKATGGYFAYAATVVSSPHFGQTASFGSCLLASQRGACSATIGYVTLVGQWSHYAQPQSL
jgi:hypothetical protein